MMTRHYLDLGIASTTQIWVVSLHQYGISLLVSQMSFHEENSDGITKCCLFSQAMHLVMLQVRPN